MVIKTQTNVKNSLFYILKKNLIVWFKADKTKKNRSKLYIIGKFRDLHHFGHPLSFEEKDKILDYINRLSLKEFEKLLFKLKSFSNIEIAKLKDNILNDNFFKNP
jgi:hypothetical protein